MKQSALIAYSILIASVALVALLNWGSTHVKLKKHHSAPVTTIRGTFDSAFYGLAQDPDVQKILNDQYGMRISYNAAEFGKIQSVDPSNQDFLWLEGSTESEEAKAQNPGKTTVNLFNTPLVFYARSSVADSLVKAGAVTNENGFYSISDWNVFWKMTQNQITTADPNSSTAASTFVGFLADMQNGGKPPDDKSLQNIQPAIQSYFDGTGLTDKFQSLFFGNFLNGKNGSFIAVGFENELTESVGNGTIAPNDASQIKAIYPHPTVLAQSTMIALTPSGGSLIKALQDPAIQKIATEKYGFRTASDAAKFQDALELPNASVMEKLTSSVAN